MERSSADKNKTLEKKVDFNFILIVVTEEFEIKFSIKILYRAVPDPDT